MDERDYYLGFSVFPGIGPISFQKLLKYFGSAKNAWKASGLELKEAGLGEVMIAKFEDFRKTFPFEAYIKELKRKEVSFIIFTDPVYPSLLKQIKNPPFLLYLKGNNIWNGYLPHVSNDAQRAKSKTLSSGSSSLSESRQSTKGKSSDGEPMPTFSSFESGQIPIPSQKEEWSLIAVVGTRRVTQYGKEVTEMMTSQLVNAGFTIVSGLAFGVDAVAHKTAIETGGKTIAVLGCGVDCCTPSENTSLYNQILESGGAVISELPLNHPPTKGSFPSRNRIVAGLSQAVLVTEGAEDSGALITADYAFKNNRKVFAVPGPITSSLSKGPHKLISKGAKLVTSGTEILEELGVDLKIKDQRSKIKKNGDTEEEKIVLRILENEGVQFDEIVRRSKLNSSQVGSLLSMMEIKGMVKSLKNGVFSVVI